MVGLFMAAVVLYLSVILPGVKTIVDPLPTETEAERMETLRVIGAGNTMGIVCLVAVLFMQVRCCLLLRLLHER